MQKSCLIFSMAIILVFCGCIFSESDETSYYDLKVEKQVDAGRLIQSDIFANRSGSGNRMLVSSEQYAVLQDPYHKWLLPPGELVAKALNNTFSGDNQAGSAVLRGTLTGFCADLKVHKFILSASYQLSGVSGWHKFSAEVPFEGDSAESIAAAASKAVNLLALDAAETLKKNTGK